MDIPIHKLTLSHLLLAPTRIGLRSVGSPIPFGGAESDGLEKSLTLRSLIHSFIFFVMDSERLNNPRGGVEVTRINYNRPKWFGGLFGYAEQHNKSSNCRYNE
jgi:hypothetical protein